MRIVYCFMFVNFLTSENTLTSPSPSSFLIIYFGMRNKLKSTRSTTRHSKTRAPNCTFFSASTSSSIYKITQNTLGIASTPSAAPQSATDRTQMPLKRIQEANIRMNGATTTWVCLSRKRNAIYHRKNVNGTEPLNRSDFQLFSLFSPFAECLFQRETLSPKGSDSWLRKI